MGKRYFLSRLKLAHEEKAFLSNLIFIFMPLTKCNIAICKLGMHNFSTMYHEFGFVNSKITNRLETCAGMSVALKNY